MNEHTALLIAAFISRNYELFQEHLDSFDIEPTEAELILNEVRALQSNHDSEMHEALRF